MKAAVLAAGLGSRLRPLTNDRPKAMVEVAGRPILDYQIEALRRAGVREVHVLVGYEGTAIESYVRHVHGLDIRVHWNRDYETTNNMYSLSLLQEELQGADFILCNGDVALEPEVVHRLVSDSAPDAIAVDTASFSAESMKVTATRADRLTGISKEVSRGQSAGTSVDCYKFSGRASTRLFEVIEHDFISAGQRSMWTEFAIDSLLRSAEWDFRLVDIAGLRWMEIDDFTDLARADRIFCDADRWVRDIRLVFVDIDGTLVRGSTPIDGAQIGVDALRDRGLSVRFLSNNSSRRPAEYVQRLASMGIEASDSEVILSTHGLRDFLVKSGVADVWVLGTRSLREMLSELDINPSSTRPEFVVLGYDTELTYRSLVEACGHLNQGVPLLATHRDLSCPSEHGPIPDAGALAELLERTTGVSPERVFGKPDPAMVDAEMRRQGVRPDECLVVGDRIETDIALAAAVGARSCLVLTGDTTRQRLAASDLRPSVVLDGIWSIGEILDAPAGNTQ